VLRGVHLPESVADHMYRASLISLVLATHEARDHAAKLALAHDLAEATVGDLTPHCGVSVEEKHRREREAMRHIRDELLFGNAIGEELFALWEEYEAGESAAAVLMKDIDK
jgi:putative hydrolases of HD superfamily